MAEELTANTVMNPSEDDLQSTEAPPLPLPGMRVVLTPSVFHDKDETSQVWH